MERAYKRSSVEFFFFHWFCLLTMSIRSHDRMHKLAKIHKIWNIHIKLELKMVWMVKCGPPTRAFSTLFIRKTRLPCPWYIEFNFRCYEHTIRINVWPNEFFPFAEIAIVILSMPRLSFGLSQWAASGLQTLSQMCRVKKKYMLYMFQLKFIKMLHDRTKYAGVLFVCVFYAKVIFLKGFSIRNEFLLPARRQRWWW